MLCTKILFCLSALLVSQSAVYGSHEEGPDPTPDNSNWVQWGQPELKTLWDFGAQDIGLVNGLMGSDGGNWFDFVLDKIQTIIRKIIVIVLKILKFFLPKRVFLGIIPPAILSVAKEDRLLAGY